MSLWPIDSRAHEMFIADRIRRERAATMTAHVPYPVPQQQPVMPLPPVPVPVYAAHGEPLPVAEPTAMTVLRSVAYVVTILSLIAFDYALFRILETLHAIADAWSHLSI